MPSERYTAACSCFDLTIRRYFDEIDKRSKQHTFVDCRRDRKSCIPGKFPTDCPDGAGQTIDLVVVRAGQLFTELGSVTIMTSLRDDLL